MVESVKDPVTGRSLTALVELTADQTMQLLRKEVGGESVPVIPIGNPKLVKMQRQEIEKGYEPWVYREAPVIADAFAKGESIPTIDGMAAMPVQYYKIKPRQPTRISP